MSSSLKAWRFPMGVACMLVLGACARADAPAQATAAPSPAIQASPASPGPLPAGARALTLPNTAVYDVPDPRTGRQYEVWVDVPESYAGSDKDYPVVFVTDAGYSFPLVRSIRNRLGQRGRNIEDFILVGLPPQQGLTSKESRSRDYTPSNPLGKPGRKASDYTAKAYGQAGAYRDYIAQHVFPLVAARYRADMKRKVYAGHSLGGLFGSYVLLTRPDMFQSYILGSPSLWFDKGEILKYEDAYARDHHDLRARVMMYTGMYETPRPGPRYFREMDMVGDMQALEQRLKARGYPGLWIGSQVVADEDHLTVFPTLVSRGLLWALPGHGPYTSG